MKSKHFQKYMSTLELKTGKIAPKGWVGVALKLKAPSPTLYLHTDTIKGAFDQKVMQKVCKEWLQEINAVNGFYGQGMFFATIPAEKLKYVDRTIIKVACAHTALMSTHTFVYGENGLRNYPEYADTKIYYLPTVEEAQDFISMAHDMTLTKSLIVWYYKWMKNKGALDILNSIRAKDPTTKVELANICTALKSVTPSIKKINELMEKENLKKSELDLENGHAYLLKNSEMSTHPSPTTTEGTSIRNLIASNILLQDVLPDSISISARYIGADTPMMNKISQEESQENIGLTHRNSSFSRPSLPKKKKKAKITRSNLVGAIKRWLYK